LERRGFNPAKQRLEEIGLQPLKQVFIIGIIATNVIPAA
jgi:hypothetical protein